MPTSPRRARRPAERLRAVAVVAIAIAFAIIGIALKDAAAAERALAPTAFAAPPAAASRPVLDRAGANGPSIRMLKPDWRSPLSGPETLSTQPAPTRPAQPELQATFEVRPVPPPAAAASSPPTRTPSGSVSQDPASHGMTRENYPWGAGTASWYATGEGVAMHYCSWVYRNSHGCGSVKIVSSETGLSVIAPVVDYCACYWGTPQQRIVDLQTGPLAKLGLSSSSGLYQVIVQPAS